MAVDLDPNDPVDADIIRRQVAAARKAGAAGRDRAKTTRGRADLEQAYDEGAAQASASQQPKAADEGDATSSAPAARSRRTTSKRKPASTARPKATKPPPAWQTARKVGQAVGPKSSDGPSLRWPTIWNTHSTSAFALGLLLYAPFIAFVRYGTPGPKAWLKAKFLNQASQGLGDNTPPKQPKSQNSTTDNGKKATA